ncbi:MAG: GtrA family protein [Bacteroidaceae bacterium]|nr:GtrA family protein [Bacteroidaceae bacterium]
MKLFFDKTMLRFLMVGVVNVTVGAGTMFLLYNLAGCSYWMSSAANYIVGGIVSFFLNKYFTFQNKERSWKQVVKFIVLVAVCYFIAYGLAKPMALWALSSQPLNIQENVAMCIGTCLYTLLNYLGQRFFAFKQR